MKILPILILFLSFNLQAQNPDLIHRAAENKAFPISGKEFLKITGKKVHYFTSYDFQQTKFYDMAITVRGIDNQGMRFTIHLEVSQNDQGEFYFTGDAECCSSRYKPQAEFSKSFRCVRGGNYEFIKNENQRIR